MRRRRARLAPRRPKDLLLDRVRVNRRAHRAQHGYQSLFYTSPGELEIGIGTALFPARPGRLVAVRLQVDSAPTSAALEVDILFDGQSVFHSSSKPKIPMGYTVSGLHRAIDRRTWTPDTKIEVAILNVGGATGPLVVELLHEA